MRLGFRKQKVFFALTLIATLLLGMLPVTRMEALANGNPNDIVYKRFTVDAVKPGKSMQWYSKIILM